MKAPPNITAIWCFGSIASEASRRAGGAPVAPVTESWVQAPSGEAEKSSCQTSPTIPLPKICEVSPPTSSSRLRALSNTTRWPTRGLGAVPVGWSWVNARVVRSSAQTSFTSGGFIPLPARPPT